jgi:hypothetical protein
MASEPQRFKEAPVMWTSENHLMAAVRQIKLLVYVLIDTTIPGGTVGLEHSIKLLTLNFLESKTYRAALIKLRCNKPPLFLIRSNKA